MGAWAWHRGGSPIQLNLPRVHAVTDAHVLGLPGFLELARRIATMGARVAIHLRDRTASGRELADRAVALRAALSGTGTPLIINARPDIAAAISADGVQLGAGDLATPDARRVFPEGRIGRSVHNVREARLALSDGANYVIAGTTYPSASHAHHQPKGTAFIAGIAAVGLPVIAIGGVTAERAIEIHAAGGYGVAAIRALWEASDPAHAVALMLAPWEAQ